METNLEFGKLPKSHFHEKTQSNSKSSLKCKLGSSTSRDSSIGAPALPWPVKMRRLWGLSGRLGRMGGLPAQAQRDEHKRVEQKGEPSNAFYRLSPSCRATEAVCPRGLALHWQQLKQPSLSTQWKTVDGVLAGVFVGVEMLPLISRWPRFIENDTPLGKC